MKRYLIEEVFYGESEGGMACGPVEGTFIAAVRYKEDGVEKWLTNAEVTGIPNFYVTEEKIADRMCDNIDAFV